MLALRHRLMFCALLGLGLGGFSFSASAARLDAVASFSVLGDMVQQVGGEDVAVTTLVGPNSDSHGYQPTSDDLKSVTKARLVFVNGLGLDGWMDKLISSAKYNGKVIAASHGVTPRTMHEDDKTVTDPHAWQDLRNGLIYADNIAAALSAAMPDKATQIRARAEAYKAKIAALDTEVRAGFAEIPEAQRIIITSHDAFGYFGAAYHIRFEAPYGMSTETEPSAAAIAKLVDQIKINGVRTVFIENMTNPQLIAQLGKDAGAQLGSTLYSDALSDAGGDAPDYLAMFRNNAPKLAAAMRQNKIAP